MVSLGLERSGAQEPTGEGLLFHHCRMGRSKKQPPSRNVRSAEARRSARNVASRAAQAMTQYPHIDSPELQFVETKLSTQKSETEPLGKLPSFKLPAVTSTREPAHAFTDRVDPEVVLEAWLNASLGEVDDEIFRSLSNLTDPSSLPEHRLPQPGKRKKSGHLVDDSETFVQSARDKESTMCR